jgi:transcriptional regulator GlxA family with amidase domain
MGLAISRDVLFAANRAAKATARVPPFQECIVEPGQALPPDAAAVVIPGLGCITYDEVGQALASPSGRWAIETTRVAAARQVHVATSCTGVFIAAEAGVLDGCTATTAWFIAPALAEHYPHVRVEASCVLVQTAACTTGGAAMAHADVMLALVDRMAGPELADLCASYLLLDRRQSQRPYMVLRALIQNDPQLVRALEWVQENIQSPMRVADVARAAGLSARTLSRRLRATCGLSPVLFIQRVRVDRAMQLLTQGASMESASERVGYSDASALRRVLRKHGRGGRRHSRPTA